MIRVQGLPLSLFQISIIFALFASILLIRNLYKGSYINLVFIYGASIIIPFIVSISPDAKSYFLLAMLTTLLLLFIPNYFSVKDVDLIEKTIIRSQYIVIPFAIYCVYLFYARGGIPEHLNLFGVMYIDLDEDALLRGGAGRTNIRMMLPYATPPVLSVIMSVCITILFFNKSLYKPMLRWLLIIFFSIILVLTASRTGVYGLFLFLILRVFTSKFSLNTIFIVTVAIILVILFSYGASQLEYLESYVGRFSDGNFEGLMMDRHFLVPLDGILLWIEDPLNFIFGIGYGSSFYMQGAHTFLPPHFLNSFVTLVVERGILGLVIDVIIVRTVVRLYRRRNYLSENVNALIYACIVALFSTIFYETFGCYLVIYVLAFVFAIDRSMYLYENNVCS